MSCATGTCGIINPETSGLIKPPTVQCHSAKADFYPFVLRTPGIKEMALNVELNQIAIHAEI